jgi:hypothetical protein
MRQNNAISINKPGMTSFMKFSFVQHVARHAEKEVDQKEIAASVDDAVRCVFDGIDSTIFA